MSDLIVLNMVNRKCDFCSNSYRKRPDVGFFSVSPAIMQHLGLAEGSSKDFICSEHFTSDCLDNAGRRLKQINIEFTDILI